jgi:biotin carboxyl carrier protein
MEETFKAKVNSGKESEIVFSDKSRKNGSIDGADFSWDMIEVKKNMFHIISGTKSFTAEVVKADLAAKTFTILVNGHKYNVDVKDRFDALLHDLGMDKLVQTGVQEVKAPMPGMVLNIHVSAGSEVKKGDALLVLEAMKMENIIKSPRDGKVKTVKAVKGTAVEKNQSLVVFE